MSPAAGLVGFGGWGRWRSSGIQAEDFLHKSLASGELFGKLVRFDNWWSGHELMTACSGVVADDRRAGTLRTWDVG